MTSEYMEKVYDAYAKVYDKIFKKVFQEGREVIPDLLDLGPSQQILEVGVGTGLSFDAYPKDINLVGVDLSKKMLDKAKERAQKGGFTNIELRKMNATKLEFEDNTFDSVVAAYFISTVPDPYICIEEMKRVCKDGGSILIINHFLNKNAVIKKLEKALSPLFYKLGFYSDLDVQELAGRCNLKIEKDVAVNFLGYWRAILIKN